MHEHETRHDGARAGPHEAQRHTTGTRITVQRPQRAGAPRTTDARRASDRPDAQNQKACTAHTSPTLHAQPSPRALLRLSARSALGLTLPLLEYDLSLSLSLSLRIPAPASLQTSLRGHADAALLPHAHTCMPCAWCCERPHPAHALGAAPGCTPRGGLRHTRVRARAQASPRHLSSSSSFSAYVRARRSLIAHEPPGAEGRQRAP